MRWMWLIFKFDLLLNGFYGHYTNLNKVLNLDWIEGLHIKCYHSTNMNEDCEYLGGGGEMISENVYFQCILSSDWFDREFLFLAPHYNVYINAFLLQPIYIILSTCHNYWEFHQCYRNNENMIFCCIFHVFISKYIISTTYIMNVLPKYKRHWNTS